MSRLHNELWGSNMLEGIKYVFRSEIPTIQDSTKPLLHKNTFIRKYNFEQDEKALEMMEKALEEDISNRLPTLDLDSVLEPVKEQSTYVTPSLNQPSIVQNNNFLNTFDVNNFDDPFHATELNSLNELKELELVLSQQLMTQNSPMSNSMSNLQPGMTKSLSNLNEITTRIKETIERPSSQRIVNEEDQDFVVIEKKDVKQEKKAEILIRDNSKDIDLIYIASRMGFTEKLAEDVLTVLNNADHQNAKIFLREDDFLTLLANVKNLNASYSLDPESIVYGCLHHPNNLNESWRLACLIKDVKEMGFTPKDIVNTSMRLQTKDRNEIIESLLNPAKINTKILQKAQNTRKPERSKPPKHSAFKKN